jgi:hypothetical protein
MKELAEAQSRIGTLSRTSPDSTKCRVDRQTLPAYREIDNLSWPTRVARDGICGGAARAQGVSSSVPDGRRRSIQQEPMDGTSSGAVYVHTTASGIRYTMRKGIILQEKCSASEASPAARQYRWQK